MAVSEAFYTTVFIGEKGCGKTSYIMGIPQKRVPSFAQDHARKHNQKVLFIDNWLERPDYSAVKVIQVEDLPRWKSGAVRIIVDMKTRYAAAEGIKKHVRNALIVFEEARVTVPGNIKETVFEEILVSNKNWRCAIVFLYHSFRGPSPIMYQYIDEIEIFKTKSHPRQRKEDIMTYDEVLAAYERVRAHKNEYYHETVKNGS